MASVQQLTNLVELNNERDTWHYSWGSSSSSRNVYKSLVGQSNAHEAFKWLWKSKCQPKHKVFFWLLLKDRLNTRNILKRKNMQLDSFDCVICNSLLEETARHLFLDCSFALACWDKIGIEVPLQSTIPEVISQFWRQLNSPFAMEAIILMSWAIWVSRNELIFNGVQPTPASCCRIFLKEISVLQYRIKPALSQPYLLWIQQLL
jgi:hypothetical protein